MKAELGYCTLERESDGETLTLSPVIRVMRELGSPKELIGIYNVIHGIGASENPFLFPFEWKNRISTARRIIDACSPNPLSSDWYQAMGASNMVAVASMLVKHGLAGVPKHKERGGKAASEIDLQEAVDLAVVHLGLSVEQVENMTMTEVVRLLQTKFPPEKKPGSDAPTLEEYEATMAWFDKLDRAKAQ